MLQNLTIEKSTLGSVDPDFCHHMVSIGNNESMNNTQPGDTNLGFDFLSTLISQYRIDGPVQERRNSIANALELLLSCTNPSKWSNPSWATYPFIADVCGTGPYIQNIVSVGHTGARRPHHHRVRVGGVPYIEAL